MYRYFVLLGLHLKNRDRYAKEGLVKNRKHTKAIRSLISLAN